MDIIQTIINASAGERKTLNQRMMKLTEETGELAEAILSMSEAPGCAYKGKNYIDIIEESCDVIICAASIIEIYSDVFPRQELESMFHNKIKKWQEKLSHQNKKN